MSVITETTHEIERTVSILKRRRPVNLKSAPEYEALAYALDRQAADLRRRASEVRTPQNT